MRCVKKMIEQNMKHLMITLLAAIATVAAMAQSSGRIFIEDFSIAPDSTVTVPVMLTNAEPTQGIQFKMSLPQGLMLEEMELTKYSRRQKMDVAKSHKNGTWIVTVYSMSLNAYPPDTAAVLMLTLTAEPEFEGGEIAIWSSKGSSEEFTTINYDDSAATVTATRQQ